jgi:hypothetical protein
MNTRHPWSGETETDTGGEVFGSIGDAYDNALAESTIGLYKNECVRKSTPFMTGPLKQLADAEEATMNWVHWYNAERNWGRWTPWRGRDAWRSPA